MTAAPRKASRIALVTGASGGIGAGIAARLADDGYHVVAHYGRNAERAERLADGIRSRGGRCTIVPADLSTPDGPQRLVSAVDRILRDDPTATLDVLVNNAGLVLGPSLDTARPDSFDRYFAVNTRAPLLLIQAASARMGRGGSIVNISSAAAHFPSAGDIVYAMSKAAVEALTFHAAAALASAGIRVNTVVPGFTDNGHPAFGVPEIRAHLESYAAMGGIGEPSDVAGAVSYLASSDARRITATTLDVSGGSALAPRRGTGIALRDIAPDGDIAPDSA